MSGPSYLRETVFDNSRLIPAEGDKHLALPGAVEFTEVESLPGSQPEPSLPDNYLYRRTEKTGLEMGIGVSLGMPEIRTLGDEAVAEPLHVAGYVRIGIFVDGDPGGCVWREDSQKPVPPALIFDQIRNLGGNINKLGTPLC
jgi:hypothetical protein